MIQMEDLDSLLVDVDHLARSKFEIAKNFVVNSCKGCGSQTVDDKEGGLSTCHFCQTDKEVNSMLRIKRKEKKRQNNKKYRWTVKKHNDELKQHCIMLQMENKALKRELKEKMQQEKQENDNRTSK